MNHQAEYLEEELRKARAEVAELRKRVCVPDVSTMARVLSDRVADARNIDLTDNWAMYGGEYIEDVQAMLAAAPAPVERVEQDAKVLWVLFDNTGGEKYIKKDADAGTLAFFDKEEDAARAKRFNPGTDYKRVEYYTTPQPAPTAAQDVAGLVGALELALEYWIDRQQRYKNRKPRWVVDAESALAAHQGGGVK